MEKIQSVAQKIANSFNLYNSPMLIQLISNGRDISVLEFCARTGGGDKFRLIKKVSGFDVINAVVELTLGEKPHIEKDVFLLKYIVDEFLYCNPGIIKEFEGFENLRQNDIISEYFILKKKGAKVSEVNSSGDRVAYFTVEGKNLDDLKKKYSIVNKNIKVVSEDGKDILKHELLRRNGIKDNMNKILVLANDSGGLYHFRRELLEKLLKTNQVIVSVPKTNEFINLKEMGCEMIVTDIDRRGIKSFRDFKLLLFYHKIIKNIQPDLVITYTIKPNIYGGMVCRKYKLNYAENVTGLGTAFQKENLLKKIVIGMYRFSMKSVKKVFFENLTNRNIFIENHIVSYDKTVVLNGAGVNLDYFTYHEYPKETSKIKFLFIGRVMKEKGIDELLEATEKIWEINKNILLEIVGRSEEDYTGK